MWWSWDAPSKYSLDKDEFYPEIPKLAGMGQFWDVPRKYSLVKSQWSSPGQVELAKGTGSFGISWFHSNLWNFFSLPLLREGGVPKGKVWDLFEKPGKKEQPHSQDVPEALIFIWERSAGISGFVFHVGVDFLWGCNLLVWVAPTLQIQNFFYREENLEVQAEFLHPFAFWELWNSLFSTLLKWDKSS